MQTSTISEVIAIYFFNEKIEKDGENSCCSRAGTNLYKPDSTMLGAIRINDAHVLHLLLQLAPQYHGEGFLPNKGLA